jgi:hypothetical protein
MRRSRRSSGGDHIRDAGDIAYFFDMDSVSIVELIQMPGRNIMVVELSAGQMLDAGDCIEVDDEVWRVEGVGMMGPFARPTQYVGLFVTRLS